ncbi:hypothetical protein DFJ74DRAFT_678614 [Hyaloraphidium curvatum]|nr:hypothetical protein DFJ74DRAFT_678614 [Hyaloraphidium curvatum]
MERWGMLGKGLPRFPPDASTGGITKQPDPIADMRPVFVAAFVNPAIVCTTPFQALEKHPALRRRLAKRPDNTEASALFLMLADPARQLFERADWTTAPEAELRMAMMALTNRGRALVSILLQDPAPARAYRSCALAEGRYDVLGALAAALGRIASVARSRRMHNTGPAENTAGLLAASLGIRGREEGWATAQTEDSEKRMGEMAAKEREDDAGAGADRCDACGKEERGGQKLMWCGKCGFARYCSTACQRGDWKAGHGAVCILVPAPGFGRAADGGARVKVGK